MLSEILFGFSVSVCVCRCIHKFLNLCAFKGNFLYDAPNLFLNRPIKIANLTSCPTAGPCCEILCLKPYHVHSLPFY